MCLLTILTSSLSKRGYSDTPPIWYLASKNKPQKALIAQVHELESQERPSPHNSHTLTCRRVLVSLLSAMVSKTTRETAKKKWQELLRPSMLTAVQNDSWQQGRRQKPFRKLSYPELLISRFYCIQEYICNEESAFLIFLLSFQIISSALNTFAMKHRLSESWKGS